MALPTVRIFVCVTPSYDAWLQHKVNAITTARAQSYEGGAKLGILKFNEGTPVWEMFQKALMVADSDFYCIVGADDWLGPDYIKACMELLLKDVNAAAATTNCWLVDKEDRRIGHDEHWSAGVWRRSIALTLGGYLRPATGRKWGCAADLWVRAMRLGYSCPKAESYDYYYRIWSGSVSKPAPDIDAQISKLRPGQQLVLGGERHG